ncbi:hypothetical protein KIL84_014037 [Mauremys mutica]|uniref:Uncharacterized protein n=1 Tax=Mauremys mutica TaxID=74926 RepID=A0A9D3WWJ2_9SAUR|nr:hypothetical protein KIL84_014037 [Mauremys mutica]
MEFRWQLKPERNQLLCSLSWAVGHRARLGRMGSNVHPRRLQGVGGPHVSESSQEQSEPGGAGGGTQDN